MNEENIAVTRLDTSCLVQAPLHEREMHQIEDGTLRYVVLMYHKLRLMGT